MGYTKYVECVSKKNRRKPYYETADSEHIVSFDNKFYAEVLVNSQIKELLPWNTALPTFTGSSSRKITKAHIFEPEITFEALIAIYKVISENIETIGHYWFHCDALSYSSNYITFFMNQYEKWGGEAGVGFCHIYKKEAQDNNVIDFTNALPLSCFVPIDNSETWGATVEATLSSKLNSTYSTHGSKLLELIELCEYAINNRFLLHSYYVS